MEETNKIIARIENRLKCTNLFITFIIVLLLLLIFDYLNNHLPALDIPVSHFALTALIIFVLAGLGLVAVRVSLSFQKRILNIISDYATRFDNIMDITRDIKEVLYGDILLDRIMQCSLDITKSDAGSILLLEDGSLVFKVVKGEKSDQLMGMSIPPDKGLTGWTLSNQQPLLIEDVSNDPRFNEHVDEITGYKTKSIICVPLKTKSTVLGVIELLNKKEGNYDSRDLEMVSYLADHASLAIERVRFLEDHKNYEIHLMEILLDTMDRFLPEKYGHSRRVAKYAILIAKSINMTEEVRRRIYISSLLHDIGFLRLSPEDSFEKEKYVRHSEIGYDMLRPINFYKDIAPIILHHHERWDGFGYPYKLKGENIPLEARILAVAEAFDSMVSKQSYRIAVTYDSALAELVRCKGTQFDPNVVDHFVSSITKPVE